jgi:hypothetical protein
MQPLGEEGVLHCGQGRQNVGTRTNNTGCGGRFLGCPGFGASSIASSYWDVDDGARSLASGSVIVTLDSTICSYFLGADNVPHALVGGAMMVTLDRTGRSSINIESPMLVDGARMVTLSGS